MRADRHMRKKRSKWRAIRNGILAIVILIAAGVAFAYYQFQPAQHFNKNSLNILLMGSDERPGETVGHSDTMILAHLDLNNHTVNAVSIPRDTRVHLAGYGYTKLTSVQFVLQSKYGTKKGIEEAANTISNFTGVPIDYYAETNFQGLQEMVDAMGGITMNVPERVVINSQVFEPGPHFVNGTTALALARERHSAAGGDYGRQMAQIEIIKGIGKAALSPGNIPKLPSLINSLSKFMIATNMSNTDMASLGMAMRNVDPNKQVQYKQLQGSQESMYDDVLQAYNDEIVLDQQQTKQTIAAFFKD